MKQNFLSFQNLSTADRIKAIVVVLFMGALLIVLGFLVGMLFSPKQFNFSLPHLPVQAAPTALIPVTAPTNLAQSADCRFSTLTLGATTFQIQDLAPGADGSLAVPGDTSGIAYRLEGIENHGVFILSPTPQNISAMSAISVGSAATVTGPGCAPATYSMTAPQAGALDASVLASQLEEAITIFFPTASSSAGFTFRGKRVTEPVLALDQPTAAVENTLVPTAANTMPPAGGNTAVASAAPTRQTRASATAETIVPTPTVSIPTPDYSEVLAEIGLSGASKSLFGLSLKIEVSIYNFGKIAIHLSDGDVALTQPDGTSLALKSSKPSLPVDIQPGETRTLEFSFDTPSSQSVTLRVLTVEYDVDGY